MEIHDTMQTSTKKLVHTLKSQCHIEGSMHSFFDESLDICIQIGASRHCSTESSCCVDRAHGQRSTKTPISADGGRKKLCA